MSALQLRFTAPDPKEIEQGAAYVLHIISTPEDWGRIYDRQGVIVWKYETDPPRPSHSLLNIIRKPDFVLLDPSGKEVLRIVRKMRFPARFSIVQDGREVGRIARRSVLRNKYSIEYEGGSAWLFRMTLFSVRFPGVSKEGNRVWILVGPSKKQWNVLVERQADSVKLVGSLAFLHREWWCYC
jgi:hypothetical protein